MFRRKPQEPVVVEWLIVGLGNPGAEYSGTRHNIGFEVVERLARGAGIKLDKSKHRARYGIGKLAGIGVAIAKPMTFMNLSGQAVAPLLREFRLTAERLLVVADETDLPLGRIRLRGEGGAGGHNGHKSIQGSLGTNQYARIRLGIGRVGKEETVDHVLGRFEPDERLDAERMTNRAVEAIARFLELGLERAMAEINAKEGGQA